MAVKQLAKNPNQSNNNQDRTSFSVKLSEDEFVRFNPMGAFANIIENASDVLKVLTKGDIKPTEYSEQTQHINYEIRHPESGAQIAFINFYENGLDANSTEEEVMSSVDNLKADIAGVQLDDIRKVMTQAEAKSMLDAL